MKNYKKIIQSIVVILVVGIGWIHNLDKKSFIYEEMRTKIVNFGSDNNKTDTLQVKESNLYTFTKDIIDFNIHHLISNL
jgi:hypothetical protein